MPSAEYFEILEEWPQPADEQGTLVNAAPTTVGPHKKKKSSSMRRQRKKLSESLAGITAAAVTVVMVATAIPSLGDAFGGIQNDFPGLISGSVCPICQEEDCAYYAQGMPGLRISWKDGWDVERKDVDDLYSMTGFTEEDQRQIGYTGAVMTEDGSRVLLRVDDGILDYMPGDAYANHWGYGEMEYTSLEPVYSDVLFEWTDEKSGDGHVVAVTLAYFPDGEAQEPSADRLANMNYVGANLSDLLTYCVDVPGVPGAQLQLATNLLDYDLETIASCVEAKVIPPHYQTFDLGSTMRLAEDAELLRSYNDAAIWGLNHYYDYQYAGGEQTVILYEDYLRKEYNLYSSLRGECSVQFATVSWHKLFELRQWLNVEAEETGHTVYFPVVELEEVTVNGITYSVYAYYTSQPVDVMEYPWIWYYYVPQQEENVAFIDHWGIEEEELQWVLENKQVYGSHFEMFREEVLNQITLRGGSSGGNLDNNTGDHTNNNTNNNTGNNTDNNTNNNNGNNTVISELCTVCNRSDCPYYDKETGLLGLRVDMGQEPNYQDGNDLHSMSGYILDDMVYIPFTGAVFTQNEQRAVLRVKNAIRDQVPGYADITCNANTAMRYHPEEAFHSDVTIWMNGTTPGEENFLYIGLVLDPAGSLLSDWNRICRELIRTDRVPLEEQTVTVRQPIADAEGVELWMITDRKDLNMEQLLALVEVELIEEGERSFNLGNTVQFSEIGSVMRNYSDGIRWSDKTISDSYLGAEGPRYFLEKDFYVKEYGLYTNYGHQKIYISSTSWDNIFARWQQLNDEAAQYGHEVYYGLHRMEDIVINGLNYHVYASYQLGEAYDLRGERKLCYWFVLEQEPTVALRSNYIEITSAFDMAIEANQIYDNHGIHWWDPIAQVTLR